MNTYIINSGNVSTAVSELKKRDRYFIIETDVTLPSGTLTIDNSVLAFRGGSFIGSTSSVVNLVSSQVSAGSYPIFKGRLTVKGLSCPEVKAEWFKDSSDTSDDLYINRAILMANGCPVVLETKTYNLKKSIKFNVTSARQTLICPGTLSVATALTSIPAIEINAQTVTLKINRIVGGTASNGYKGVGIKFNAYIAHSNIEVNTMRSLHRGFSVDPDVRGSEHAGKLGGIQYCLIKFGSIQADYCIYINVYSGARVSESNPKSISNWFNENQITGELMEGKYGIYTVDPTEAKVDNPALDPRILTNVMNGLKIENISFERITGLALRLRAVINSSFLNLQMFNCMPVTPGSKPNDANDFAPWIDMENIDRINMTFNSYVAPAHIKVGDNCKNSYIRGAIMDKPGSYSSHFDLLGIDTWSGKDVNGDEKSLMFVTSSVTPFNMAKDITVPANTTVIRYIRDLLPNLKDGSTDSSQISLPVLPATLNVEVNENATLVVDLSGLKTFAPCLYTVNAKISGQGTGSHGTLQFRTSDNTVIEGGTYANGICKKEVAISGLYSIQWLSDWKLRIIQL